MRRMFTLAVVSVMLAAWPAATGLPALQAVQDVRDPIAGTTSFKLFFVELEDDAVLGKKIGCNDSVVAVEQRSSGHKRHLPRRLVHSCRFTSGTTVRQDSTTHPPRRTSRSTVSRSLTARLRFVCWASSGWAAHAMSRESMPSSEKQRCSSRESRRSPCSRTAYPLQVKWLSRVRGDRTSSGTRPLRHGKDASGFRREAAMAPRSAV